MQYFQVPIHQIKIIKCNIFFKQIFISLYLFLSVSLLNYHTPECHKDSKEDCGWIVKEMACSSCTTSCHQLPVAAGAVTKWTHRNVVSCITNLQTDKTRTDKESFMRTGEAKEWCSSNSGHMAPIQTNSF